jgi:hypothetical protein
MPNSCRDTRSRISLLLPLLFLLGAGLFAQTDQTAPPTEAAGVRAMHVLGLEGVKRNIHGTLTTGPGGLDFKAGGAHGTITIASIQDVFTSQDSHQTGGKVLTVAKMGVPYGGGRVVSLFSHEKQDSLTVEYADANGGLHGVIFVMQVGQAPLLKKQLVDLGAHASVPVASPPENQGDKQGGDNKQ